MIIISPYAKGMRNGEPHPKNYPYWEELVSQIKEPIVQIGIEGEKQLVADFRKALDLKQLTQLVYECRTWIAVDSFFQHFCWDLGKRGIVLFGQSDPNIFGHPENVNLLVDRKNLREKQFWMWEQTKFDPTHFVKPDVILKALEEFK